MNADTIRAIIAAEQASFNAGRENDPTYSPAAKEAILGLTVESETPVVEDEVVTGDVVEVVVEAPKEPAPVKAKKARK